MPDGQPPITPGAGLLSSDWLPGPANATASPVVVSFTDFRATTDDELAEIFRTGIELGQNWPIMSGAVGLWLWGKPAQTDFRTELSRISVPTLLVQGDGDASAPLALTGARTAEALPGCELILYENAPHGLYLTHRDRLNRDLLRFIGAPSRRDVAVVSEWLERRAR